MTYLFNFDYVFDFLGVTDKTFYFSYKNMIIIIMIQYYS